MAAHREVEIKFRVDSLAVLTRSLRASKFRLLTPSTHEVNTLYDLPGQPLRRRGEILRLRKYGSEWVLTHKSKGQVGRHKSRVETETAIADGLKMEVILQSLGFKPVFRYEKFRAEWGDGKGHVVVDKTPIGNFGEIEGPPQWIDRVANKLGIKSEQYMTGTYAGLFFEWKKRTRSKAREMTFKAIPASSSR